MHGFYLSIAEHENALPADVGPTQTRRERRGISKLQPSPYLKFILVCAEKQLTTCHEATLKGTFLAASTKTLQDEEDKERTWSIGMIRFPSDVSAAEAARLSVRSAACAELFLISLHNVAFHAFPNCFGELRGASACRADNPLTDLSELSTESA